MLTPKYLREKPDRIVSLFQNLEHQVIEEVSASLKKTFKKMDEEQIYKVRTLLESGYDLDDISKEIAKTTKLSKREVEKSLIEASKKSYNDDLKRYKKGGKDLPKLEDNPSMNDFINSTIKNAKGDIDNLTGTTGFIDTGRFKSIDQYYHDTLDYAVIQVGSGAYSYEEALYQAVRDLADSGLRTVDYNSGRTYHLDSAARMSLLTSMNQITGHMSLANAEMVEQDLMEITAHLGARPSHAEWQGQIVSLSGRKGYLSKDDIGYGTAGGFQGANCRHGWFAYFEGISSPAYTREFLEELDNETVMFQGREYNYYDATQKQRYMERQIKKHKRRASAFKGAGLDKEYTSQQIKVRRLENLYKDFSDETDIRAKMERADIYE